MATTSIGTPYLIGTATNARPTLQVSVGTAVPNSGYTIIIGTDTDHTPGWPNSGGITDTQGNSYTRLVTQGDNNPYISMWAAFNVQHALSTSDTITITYPGTGTQVANAIIIAVPGMAASPLDQTDDTYGTSRSQTLETGQLGLAGELAVVYWSAAQTAGAPTPASDFTSVAQFQGSTNTHWVNLAWKIEQTAGPVLTSATIPSPGNGWGGVLATFLPVIYPTATLHCGGSVTPYHVQTANATATLGCGGSLLGPAELAPIGPPPQPVFPAGYGPLASDFEEWVQDALAYCSSGTVFRAEQHTSQAVPAATFTPLACDTILEDPWNGWSSVATGVQAANSWLAPFTGLYRITFRFTATATTSDQWREAALGVSGVNPWFEAGGLSGTSGAAGSGADANILVPLIGGSDYVQMLAWSGSATSTDVSAPGRYASVEITAVQTDLPPPPVPVPAPPPVPVLSPYPGSYPSTYP